MAPMQCVSHSSLVSGWTVGKSKATSRFEATAFNRLLGTTECHQMAETTLRRNTMAAKSSRAKLAAAAPSLVPDVPEAIAELAAAAPSLAPDVPEAIAELAAAAPSLAPINPAIAARAGAEP